MKNKRKKTAVTEIVGVALLLGMSIAMYSVVQVMVFSYPFQPATPSVNLVGSINEDNVIKIGHFGGESISIDAKIIIRTSDDSTTFNVSDDDNSNLYFKQNNLGRDDLWEIGEIVTYDLSDLTSSSTSFDSVHVTVIDVKTNSVVMMGYIQGGSS